MSMLAAGVAALASLPVHDMLPVYSPADCDGTEVAAFAVAHAPVARAVDTVPVASWVPEDGTSESLRAAASAWRASGRCSAASATGAEAAAGEWRLFQASLLEAGRTRWIEGADAAVDDLLLAWSRAVQLQRGDLYAHLTGLAIETVVASELEQLAPELGLETVGYLVAAVDALDAQRTPPDLTVERAYLEHRADAARTWAPAESLCVRGLEHALPRIDQALAASDPGAALQALDDGVLARVPFFGTCSREALGTVQEAVVQAEENDEAIDALIGALTDPW